jgi:hypothetical protein
MKRLAVHAVVERRRFGGELGKAATVLTDEIGAQSARAQARNAGWNTTRSRVV